MQLAERRAVTVVIQLLAGVVLGALLALDRANTLPSGGPLSGVLKARSANLAIALRHVVFAQTRISALNTVLTGRSCL